MQKRTDGNISDSLEEYGGNDEALPQYGGGGIGNSDVVNVGMFHPFTAILSGPTQCGKTNFIFRFIENVEELVIPQPERIVYCYGEYQPIFAEYPQVEFREGLPKCSDFDGRRRTLLIIDDFMNESGTDVSKIFTKGSHHRNISVFFITQNLFYKSKDSRTMSLNAHYIVAFKNPRDVTQIATLAKQMYPGSTKYMIEAYQDATSKPFGYLLIDLKPQTDERIRLRTNIFPGEVNYVYTKRY